MSDAVRYPRCTCLFRPRDAVATRNGPVAHCAEERFTAQRGHRCSTLSPAAL
jgi:hypothetical protein